MTIILAALATVTSQWLPNWNRGMAQVQRAERLAMGLDRIVADLSVAEMIPINGDAKVPLFEGTELAVTFVRTAVGPNARPGLEIVRLIEKADNQGLAMVRERAPFVPMPSDAQIRFADQVVLVRSAVSRDVFLCRAGSGLAADLARPDAASGDGPYRGARRRDRTGAAASPARQSFTSMPGPNARGPKSASACLTAQDETGRPEEGAAALTG